MEGSYQNSGRLTLSTVEAVKYSGGLIAVRVEGYHQYSEGLTLSTVEVAQYSGGCPVQWRAKISTVEG